MHGMRKASQLAASEFPHSACGYTFTTFPEVAKASFDKVLVEMDINCPLVSSFVVTLPLETSVCIRISPARDDEGFLKFGLWLKDWAVADASPCLWSPACCGSGV